MRWARWLILAVLGFTLERTMNSLAPQYLSYAYTLIALLITWEAFLWLSKHKLSSHLIRFRKKMGVIMSYLVVASFGAIIAVGYWWGMQKILVVPSADITQQENALTKKPNLHGLFDNDFNTLLRSGQDRNIGAKSKDGTKEITVKISEKEYLDFQGKSKFLGYYVPYSPVAYGICEYLPDLFKISMEELESSAEVKGGFPWDSHQTSSRELVFSGRIYIYHENDFTLQQLAALERLYESKGLSVIFRGPAYLSWQLRK